MGRRFPLFVLALFAVLVLLTHSIWLAWMGEWLVLTQAPSHADVVVVLAGDPSGHRILRAADLVKQGYAPKVIVSGPGGAYDLHECDLAIPFVLRRGYPASWFIPVPHGAHSTEEEAQALLPVLQQLRARTVLVVTSNYHSRRASRILRARWPGIDVHMVAVADDYFSPSGWWHTREGRKTFLLEWTKTFAAAVGM